MIKYFIGFLVKVPATKLQIVVVEKLIQLREAVLNNLELQVLNLSDVNQI